MAMCGSARAILLLLENMTACLNFPIAERLATLH